MTKSRNFILTKNNPNESLTEFFEYLKRESTCACAQLERGESGTPHFQAFVSYPTPRHLKAMIKKFPGCHVESAKNAMAAWKYCQKEEGRLEGPLTHGIPPAAKNVKGDTKERNKMILEKGEVWAVEEGHVPIEKFKLLKQSVDLFRVMKKDHVAIDKLENEYHWGVTGAGKSRQARDRFPDAYIKSNNVWWDGYAGEETVIIDELGPKLIGAHHLKQWMDHYPFKAEAKGGYMQIRPKRFIITSNYSLRECYPDENDYLPLERRLTMHHYPEKLKCEIQLA